MAAANNLDYNQVQEQSPATGDTPSKSGGLLTWNFRADPNLAWDPSQSYFVMEFVVKTFTGGVDYQTAGSYDSWQQKYIPDFKDWYAFFPLRCFTAMSHIIDGVTVAHTNQPWADKIMQEKFLTEASRSNQDNFESLVLARNIDDGKTHHNMFMSHTEPAIAGLAMDAREYALMHKRFRIRNISETVDGAYTVMFQPPFDLWTKHQRISGGNHQIQLNLYSAKLSGGDQNETYWGDYMTTEEGGVVMSTIGSLGYYGSGFIGATNTNPAEVTRSTLEKDLFYPNMKQGVALFPNMGGSNNGGNGKDTLALRGTSYNQFHVSNSNHGLQVDIRSIRLMRRMVRFTVERPLGMEEFSATEMAFYHGTAISGNASQTQNFLLPASTFAVAFYWRSSTDPYYNVVDGNRKITYGLNAGSDGQFNVAGNYIDITKPKLGLKEFYFTYGGETYPSQRINDIYNGVEATSGPGLVKLQTLTYMLQGAMNTDQDRFNMQYSGEGLLDRLDGSCFMFPVAKHNNSDNSDLQVYYSVNAEDLKTRYGNNANPVDSTADLSVSLVCVAFYDANLQLSYNAANQLEKVNKVEWK